VFGDLSLLPYFDSFLKLVLCVSNTCFDFQVRLNEAVKAASLFEPHVVLTVDSKGFSFRFLKQLRGTTTKLMYLQ